MRWGKVLVGDLLGRPQCMSRGEQKRGRRWQFLGQELSGGRWMLHLCWGLSKGALTLVLQGFGPCSAADDRQPPDVHRWDWGQSLV